MDIRYTNKEFQFLLRVSILIFNKDESKVLLFNVEGRDFYMLPGGKIGELEESIDAARREVKEELGWEATKSVEDMCRDAYNFVKKVKGL